jgi:hypothetical protein
VEKNYLNNPEKPILDIFSIKNNVNEIKDLKSFYASKLIKMSAKQYAFLSYKPQEYAPSLAMHIGNSMADYILANTHYREMGGLIKNFLPEYKLYFSNDAICYNEEENILDVYESKFFYKNELDDWKIKSSLYQLMFYSALSHKVKSMETSSFRKHIENHKINFKKNKIVRSNLVIISQENVYFYNKIYDIQLLEKVYEFVKDKAKMILLATKGDWGPCKKWDEDYKHKEMFKFCNEFSLNDMEILV